MGRPMTPIPINPTCMIQMILSFHFYDDRSTFDNLALMAVNTPYLAFIGSHNGMLHLHGAQDTSTCRFFTCSPSCTCTLTMVPAIGAVSAFCEWAALPPCEMISASGG